MPRSTALPASLRVAVAADQSLVGEAVRAAVAARCGEAVLLRWPRPSHAVGKVHRSRRGPTGIGPDVGLMMSDFERLSQVRAAQVLISGLQVPWLVLAGVPQGPAWGALYEEGAALVSTPDISLDRVCLLLEDLAAGRSPHAPRRRRPELIRDWRGFLRRRGAIAARLETLTDREDEVLRELYRGVPVRAIAEESAVTESTVRSQVKMILRKLEVSSQLAAVAAYEAFQTESTAIDETSWSSPSD